MEEIIKRTLAEIPHYLTHFFELIGSPREFPVGKLPKDESETQKSLAEALAFCLISYTLIVVLTLFQNPSENLWKDLGVVAVSTLVQMCLYVCAIFLGWKVFGSKKKFHKYFIIYSYHFGVAFVLLSLVIIISNGYLKLFDPQLYPFAIGDKFTIEDIGDNLFDSSNSAYRVKWGIMLIGYLFISIWTLIGWGAYRILNEADNLRSFGALMVTGIFSWVVIVISFLLLQGIL